MQPTYSLLSSLKGQQRQMDAVSNNLANANTPGFKEDLVLFREYYNEAVGQDMESEEESFAHHEYISPYNRGATSLVMPDHVAQKMFNGKFKPTNNPFDLALKTDGFFTLETIQGERFTRNGQFMVDGEGYLSTVNGDRVLGKNGLIQVKGNEFSVGQDGSVIVDNKTVDVLKIVDFEQRDRLTKLGNSYWAPSSTSQVAKPASQIEVHQGVIEGSNVDTVKEMVKMISVNRSYEASQKALRSVDEIDQKSISLARV